MISPEALFARWLAALDGEPLDLEELQETHPEHAEALGELHGQWQRLETLRKEHGLAGTLTERLKVVHGSELDPKVDLADEGSSDFTEELVSKLSERAQASTRYRREGELARGGMGAVLRVWDEDLRRQLAMKVLIEDEAPKKDRRPDRDKRLLARLLEEAQVTAQLDHPGIVPVHELGLGTDGGVFFTMKLVRGKTLGAVFDELAAGEGGWTKTRVLGLLVKVCEAMSYAHVKGVIHRDLKPANVMVGKFGEVYVMDWGLAKILDREDEKDVRLRAEPAPSASFVRSDRSERTRETPDSPLYTMDGDVVGTPAYMSPEQAEGRTSRMGPPSDVYALGAMLYHLLAGHMPFVPSGAQLNNYAVWQRVQEGPPRPLHEVAPDAPAELTAICERAMAREAADRYEDMSALAADLLAYVEGRVVHAYETGALAETKKWVRRNKGLAGSLATAVLLLVLGLASAIYLGGEAQANFELAEERREDLASANKDLEELNEDLAAQTRTAELAAAAERARADEVLRLSALQDYDELIAKVDGLWPAHPENIVAFESWTSEARALVADLPLHLEKLAELRSIALPRSDEDREADRASHPDAPRLAALRSRVAEAKEGDPAQETEELATMEAEILELETLTDARRTWTFPETEKGREARWWHGNLSQLIESLEGLVDGATGLVSESDDASSDEYGWSVPRRLRFAERLRNGLGAGGEWSPRWTAAIAAIRQHPDYGGLELTPQVGLVPIGPDPTSGLWEFWHVATGVEPLRGEDGTLVPTGETGVVLVLIPSGKFWMGASAEPDAGHNLDGQAQGNEGPVHEVELSAYFLSKYELTQGQWLRFTGRNPSYYQSTEDATQGHAFPVEQVSWQDAKRELSRMGLGLPSEAQWEYACRAGTETPWWTGPERDSLVEWKAVNLADQAAERAGAPWATIKDWPELDDGFAVVAPIGTYAANPWGLHEVHGNLWEWCEDGHDASFYGQSPRTDPVAPWEDAGPRVCRGGSFNSAATSARSAYRSFGAPSFAGHTLGVRPARALSK